MPAFWRVLGLPGLADVHVHFLPPRMLRRVWAYFDEAGPLVGVTWPIRYRWTDEERVALTRLELGPDWLRAVCWDNPARLFGDSHLAPARELPWRRSPDLNGEC